MKKNPTEENEEKLQNENQLKTNIAADGKRPVKILIYSLIVIVIIIVLYFITIQNDNTFRIIQ